MPFCKLFNVLIPCKFFCVFEKEDEKKKKEDDEERTWFSKGAFDDGYQIGDISKTILGTAGDIGVGALKGIGNLAEGLVDAAAYGVAGLTDLFGADDDADRIRRNATDEVVNDLFEPASNFLDKYSVIGEKGDQIPEGLGYVGGILLTGGLGAGAGLGTAGTTALTTGVTGLSGFGSGTGEAYKSGATDTEAHTYGLITGVSEAATELIFGGLGKSVKAVGLSSGLSSADDMLASKLTSKISNTLAKNVIQGTVKAGAEGTEEVLAGTIQAIGKKVTYMSEEELGQLIEDENLLEQFIVGAITSGIVQTSSIAKSTSSGRDFVSGYTQNEQSVIDKEVENRVAEAEKDGTKLTNKQKTTIIEEVQEDLAKGYISTDTIESTLGGKTYNQLKSVRDHKTNLETQIKELENKPNAEITVKEMEQLNSLREQLEQSSTNTLESKLQAEMEQNIKSDGYLQRSYQEKAKRSKEFTYEVAETDSEFRRGVLESTKGKLNDTTRSHETAEALVKLSEDRKMQYKFTNTKELQQMKLVPEGKTANGLYVVEKDGKREILVNTDSKKYVEAVLVHETAHDFQTTSPETYTKLQDITKEFAEASGDYARIHSEVTEMYKNVEGVNIEEEVTSRLLEDYLGNKDFISNLSTKEPNIVQKIINEIKYLYKKFTAGSPEARKLVELQHTLEETYKEAYRQTEVKTKDVFKDSKVRDDKGNLKKVYHGTRADFDTFDINRSGENYEGGWSNSGRGIYFTEDMAEAEQYAKDSTQDGDTKIKEVYLDIENPFDTSQDYSQLTDMANEYNIEPYFLERGDRLLDWFKNNNIDAGEVLKKYGYDGIVDHGHYVVFDSNQIINTDGTRDIKYSITDNQGRELSKEQQTYFEDSKARDENGSLITLYHGSNATDTTVFTKDKFGDRGVTFLTDDPDIADTYRSKEGKRYEFYADMKNPLVIDADNSYWNQIDYYGDGSLLATTDEIVRDALNGGELDTNGKFVPYDGVIFKNVVDRGRYFHKAIGNRASTIYVTFNSNQIKNVDNTNPTENPDIRYSLSEEGKLVDNKGNDITLDTREAGTHGTLMAIHNLTEGKLKGILDLGGFPVPSIAIMNTSTTNLSYGDISVLFDKTTIDPAIKENEVYGSDVYSPRFPQTVQKVNEKQLDKLNKYLGKTLYIEDTTLEETVDKNRYTKEFIDKFAEENNIKVDNVYKENGFNYTFSTDENVKKFVIDNDITFEKLLNDNQLKNEFYDLYRQSTPETLRNFTERKIETFEKAFADNNVNIGSRLDSDFNSIKNGSEKILDEYATQKALRDKVLGEYENQYTKFLIEKLSPVFGEKYIRNSKELFTPSGNRRTFKQLYNEYTLDNIVKEMKGKVRGEEGFFYGAGTIRSQVTPQFKSIADIKASESKLVTNSQMENVKEDIDSDLNNLSVTAKNFGGYSYDSYETALNEIAGLKKITPAKAKEIFNDYGFENVPDILVDKSIEFLEKLKNAPTEYFESKPQRAVGLDEVQAIVVPNRIDAEVKQQLLDKGLNVVEYDPNVEGDRQNKINQFDDLKFSLSNESDIAPTSTRNQTAAEDIKLQVEEAIAPLQEEITQLKEELQNITDIDYSPATQEVVEQQGREEFNTIDDVDSPQQLEELAPTGEQVTPTESLFDTRDYEEVGSKKVNAYQYDNPEVRPYFQTAAREMLTDLQNSTRGERLIIGNNSQVGTTDYYYSGTKRATTEDIADLLDGMGGKYKYSYAEIEKGLRAIIEDNGAENNAVSKRIEFYLDKRLREGYTDIDGYEIPADTEYLDMLRAKGITDYYNSIPLGEAPVDNVSNREIAPTKLKVSEAIKPAPDKDTHGYKLVRVKTDAELQTEANEEIAKILTEEPKTENTRNKRKWAILKANVFDKGIVFEDVSLKHKNRDLMGKWDYTLTAEARGQNVIGNGHYEYDPYSKTSRQVSKSLNDIRAEVDNTGLTKEFYDYIYHKHNVDRMRLEGRFEGMQNKPVFGYNVTAAQSQQVVNQYETQHPSAAPSPDGRGGCGR